MTLLGVIINDIDQKHCWKPGDIHKMTGNTLETSEANFTNELSMVTFYPFL
jgi:hypothetical protein